jgi:hypothetical protein
MNARCWQCLSTPVRGLRAGHAIALWKAHDLRALSKKFFSKQTALGCAVDDLLVSAGAIEDDVHSLCGRADWASSGLSVTELEVVGRSINL